MILPTTYLAALVLLLTSMLCWGSWANTQKLATKWRFELFYYDYSIGLALCAVVAAYTFGFLHPTELTFLDNFLIAGYRKMAYGVAGGVVFNLANLLLVAAIAIAGMSVAFPISIGLAMVIGVIWNYILNPQGNALLLFGGAALVVVAIIIDAFAYSEHLADVAAQKKHQPMQVDPRTKKAPKAPTPLRGILISVAAGILMGMFYPLVEMGKSGEDGVGPYGIFLLFAGGVVVSSLIYLPFFMNFPIEGEPIQFRSYFKGTKTQHIWGIIGGIVWGIGGLSNFLAASAPPRMQVGPAVSYAMGQGATMVSALWGLLVWREFAGASQRVKLLLFAMILVFVAGLAMISLAPIFAGK